MIAIRVRLKLVFDDVTTINGPVLSMVHQKAEDNNATLKQHELCRDRTSMITMQYYGRIPVSLAAELFNLQHKQEKLEMTSFQ